MAYLFRTILPLLAASTLLLTSCAGPPAGFAEIKALENLNQAGQLPALPEYAPLALNQEMKALLDAEILPIVNIRRRSNQLLKLLFDPAYLNITYRYANTLTAEETFGAGQGNCLSISNLVVAMARYAGLDARFQDVEVASDWTKVGDTYVLDKHINVRIIDPQGKLDYEVDARPYPVTVSKRRELISDEAAFAQFYNNKAAEALQSGDDLLAFAYFKKALESDDGISFIWANLGTLYSEHRQFRAAEQALLMALSLYPRDYLANKNLALLYQHQGQQEKAERFLAAAQKSRFSNPYFLAREADKAFQKEAYETALAQIKRSLQLDDSDSAFHLLAAKIYDKLDNPKQAAHHLRQAEKKAATEKGLKSKASGSVSPAI